MSNNKQKLELTWVGKGEEDILEPRILLECPERHYGIHPTSLAPDEAGNLLIHGDNLLALRALLAAGYGGKVKCIYIDPPYNTGSAFEHYDDNVEHSLWLSLMKQRLELLRELLCEDGVLFSQIDDSEMPYLTILLDEIFQRANRINIICVNMSNASGVKITSAKQGARFPKIKEYVLLYVKDKKHYRLSIPKIGKEKWDDEYNLIIPEFTEELLEEYSNGELRPEKVSKLTLQSLKSFMSENHIEDSTDWKSDNAYRIFASKPNPTLLSTAKEIVFNGQVGLIPNASGTLKLIKTDFNRSTKTARIELVSAATNGSFFLGDHWNDIVTTGGVAQEGQVEFPNGKKPEKLLHRIIACATAPGDLVLDSFLGSGTTAAVAHKMARRWIGIELGDHAYSHCATRLQRVIDGTDKGGISKAVGWQGGGGYRFFELAPTLIKVDEEGIPVINPAYNGDMLAAAMAIHEGFTYAPDSETFWKQGYSSESDFIYTTTQHLTQETLSYISDSLRPEESLVLCCTSYSVGLDTLDTRITIKRIPQLLLDRCRFCPDTNGYNLNIVPQLSKEEEEECFESTEEHA